ncbi:MAG: phosphoribosylformimino-5-aminoimidazole carboxamide ribotide isomerase [Lachnospiraceae bacterium]|nr:phosphoribosylformimino-5-aminoimidazole carboxamide ribotide isomerase [Lachnospiraceae bacterium]MBQ2101354.1 phosphoribosylformimino-5-aminoimidazole carboxamide ribotide isomerase [Lachnospiraceae bacterium]MBQ3906355.1 phosphoribosylformimino-5-aminoimidazole carboxamide ribotide isomerase [Lachnospiraceae bacterium]
MEFRPCIDIHNGKVKQIVGASLKDAGDQATENFVASKSADYYAKLYQEAGIKGGHVILLNSADSEYYEATKAQAMKALKAYPGGLQVGGGINSSNANEFLNAGASHVIVTSYVFQNGRILFERLYEMDRAVGKEHLVLDVSCRRVGDDYFVVTDRWQKLTEEKVTEELLWRLSNYCAEFLIHAVDVEGKNNGIETQLAETLGKFKGIPVTYAGGVHEYEDVRLLGQLGQGRLNVTVGSALDLFGGKLDWKRVLNECKEFAEK